LTSIEKIDDDHCSIDQQPKSEVPIGADYHEAERSKRKTLEYAKKYIEKGLSIIPIFCPGQSNFRGEKSDGKEPAVPKVMPYRERLATNSELCTWFAHNDRNIGIVTGQISCSFALDIDGDNSKRDFQKRVDSLSKNLQNAINNTMHVITGGGNALIIFRYNKEDFPNGIESEKIVAYPNHDEIVISGDGRYVVMPPSIHKSGKEYELLSDSLLTLTKDEVEELLSALKTIKISITTERTTRSDTIDITFTERFAELDDAAITDIAEKLKIVYVDGSMHDMILYFTGYARKYLRFKKEDVLKIAEIIHAGDAKNFNTIEDTYRNDLSQINGYHAFEEILQIITKNDAKIISDIFSTLDKYKVRTSIIEQLSSEIAVELKRHVFEVNCYNPLNFVISHSDYKQIVNAKIDKIKRIITGKDGENEELVINKLNIRDIIISAIPKKITRYEHPIGIEIKYEIEFETPTGQVFKTEPKTIEEILVELRVKGLVYKTRAAEEALPAILNAYHRENKLIVKRELETPGFYLIDNKIEEFKVEQEYQEQPTKEEIVRCADVLNELVTKYKRKEIMPSFIKWGIVAPFSYVLKQLEEGEERWMPWLYPYGWTNTGKTTSGRIVLAIWRKHKDKKKHDVGFSNIDNVARFARAVSYDTYPVLINEVHLNDERQKQLVEAIKHAVQSQTARARLSSKSTAEYISALSPCILTSNNPPPEDPAFQRRIIPIYFSQEDEPTEEEREAFNTFLNDNIDSLGTLGDFTINYILTNQRDIIHNNDWKAIAKIVLTDFYKSAEREVPEWINYFVQETQVQDAAAEQEQIIRSYFVKTINETYSKHYRTSNAFEQQKEDQTLNNNKLEHRLIFCCDKELIPSLRKKENGNILIMQSIVKEMKDQRIHSIGNLTELARILQCEVKPTKIGDKTFRVIAIPTQKFIDFVLPTL
jgi:hypothetical protein